MCCIYIVAYLPALVAMWIFLFTSFGLCSASLDALNAFIVNDAPFVPAGRLHLPCLRLGRDWALQNAFLFTDLSLAIDSCLLGLTWLSAESLTYGLLPSWDTLHDALNAHCVKNMDPAHETRCRQALKAYAVASTFANQSSLFPPQVNPSLSLLCQHIQGYEDWNACISRVAFYHGTHRLIEFYSTTSYPDYSVWVALSADRLLRAALASYDFVIPADATIPMLADRVILVLHHVINDEDIAFLCQLALLFADEFVDNGPVRRSIKGPERLGLDDDMRLDDESELDNESELDESELDEDMDTWESEDDTDEDDGHIDDMLDQVIGELDELDVLQK